MIAPNQTRPAAVAGTGARPEVAGQCGRILVVDDDRVNRAILRKPLESNGYSVVEAEGGEQALRYVLQHPVDAILLDIMMPKVDGFELCRLFKRHDRTSTIPVLMVTALSERDERLRGIECGACDFLTKPVDVREMLLRVQNAVHTKRLYDQLNEARKKADLLLLNVLPAPIAQRIMSGESDIADQHPDVTVLVAELAGVAELTGFIAAEQIVYLLNEVFSSFDALLERHGLEKIKTIGGTYIAAAGLSSHRTDHAAAAAITALEMWQEVGAFNSQYNTSLKLRVGLSTGPAVAGVIGRKRFSYDIWGLPVNQALRLASRSHQPGLFAASTVYDRLRGNFLWDDNAETGHDQLEYRLIGRAEHTEHCNSPA